MSAPIAAIAAGTAAVFYLLRRRPSAQPQVPGAPPPGMTWEDWQAYDDRKHEGAWLGYKAIPSAVTEEERRIIASGGQISSEKTAAGTVHTSMS